MNQLLQVEYHWLGAIDKGLIAASVKPFASAIDGDLIYEKETF